MAKLAILAALFAGLVAAAIATTQTTVVTFTDEEGNPQQQCRQQMGSMRHCIQYMRMGRSSDDASFLRSAVDNDNPRREQLEECCMELRNMSPDCRCMAIKETMRMAQQQYGAAEEMMGAGGMMRRAEMLPQRCGWRSPRQCRIRAVFV